MKCTFCGTENMPGRTHCIACGTPLPVAPTPDQSIERTTSEAVAQTPVITNAPKSESIADIGPNPENLELPSQPFAEAEVLPVMTQAVEQKTVSPSWLDTSSSPATESSLSPGTVAEVANTTMAPSIASVPMVSNMPNAPAVVEVANSTEGGETPSHSVVSNNGGVPRVNVQFDDNEIAEVPMPVHQEPMPSTPANNESVAVGESESHTGPWLALLVLGGGLVVIVLVIYFIFQLLFGGAKEPVAVVTPTAIVVPTVSSTPTPVRPQESANDVQREQDINDLKVALSAYYRDNGHYPNATSYNGLLNALIGGSYIDRRIQDPSFPTQEYAYMVDSAHSSYEVVITFDSTASTLLVGASSPVYHLRGAQGD